MRRKAVQIMIKTIQRRLDAILHWNISFVGGFLGGYAILSHAGVFGSAQTGNLMEMASNVRFMEWEELGLRLLAMVIFACGVIASYMLTKIRATARGIKPTQAPRALPKAATPVTPRRAPRKNISTVLL